jgi:hypothetical protein
VTFARQRNAFNAIVKKAYHLHFVCKIGDQDKSWARTYAAVNVQNNLSQWLNGKRHAMPFAVPVVWREPSNHATDCYFCMVPPVSGGITKKKKWTIVYPNIPSALRPVSHGEENNVPETPKGFTIDSEDEEECEFTSGSPEPPASTEPHVFHSRSSAPQPHILTQDELDDLVSDLELIKSKPELPGSRLKQWNLLEKNFRISSFRSRHQPLVSFFRNEDDIVFRYDVDGLMNALGIKHYPQEWQLFIDSSKLSLKTVLLYNFQNCKKAVDKCGDYMVKYFVVVSSSAQFREIVTRISYKYKEKTIRFTACEPTCSSLRRVVALFLCFIS